MVLATTFIYNPFTSPPIHKFLIFSHRISQLKKRVSISISKKYSVMEGGVELNTDYGLQSETQISEDLFQKLNLDHNGEEENEDNHSDDEYEYEEDEDGEEFSFLCGESTSPIAAEDAFMDGQIKPVFPVFNRVLLLDDLPSKPVVNKVFVEMSDGLVTSSAPVNDDITGPYCDWSNRKAVEVEAVTPSPEVCKKSNSTGFSKIWRFKDFLGRSNSDGRDTFVFLNNGQSSAPAPEQLPAAVVVVKKDKETTVKVIRKVKKVNKGKALSAHEVYMRNKVKENERRRSYLPYRTGLTGFFTNTNGGLTKNVHPF